MYIRLLLTTTILLHVQVVKRNQNMVYVDVKLQFYALSVRNTQSMLLKSFKVNDYMYWLMFPKQSLYNCWLDVFLSETLFLFRRRVWSSFTMRTSSPSARTTRTDGLCPLPSHSSSLSEWRCRVLLRKYVYWFQIDIINKQNQVNIILILMYEYVCMSYLPYIIFLKKKSPWTL